MSERPATVVIDSPLGRFQIVNPREAMRGNREDGWQFECPGCGEWAYMDGDQWHGRVSVEHECGYHETHDYSATLDAALAGERSTKG